MILQNNLMNSTHYTKQNKIKGAWYYLILPKSELLKHMIEEYKVKNGPVINV